MKKILAAVCALCLCSSQTAFAADINATDCEDENSFGDIIDVVDSSSAEDSSEDSSQTEDSSQAEDSSQTDASSREDNSFSVGDNSNKDGSNSDACRPPESSSLPDKTPFYGDVNYDNQITSEDALEVLKYVVGLNHLSSEQFKRADVNRDHKVNASDALYILKYIVREINSFYSL